MTRRYTKQNHTNLLGLAKLFKFGVEPFALTSCGLPQNPKSEIPNPKSAWPGFRKEDQSAHPIPRVVLTMRTPSANDQQRSTNHERAVRRQLFDDSTRGVFSVMGIFLIWRGFPEMTRYSRNAGR
jgi:hypothetical protein